MESSASRETSADDILNAKVKTLPIKLEAGSPLGHSRFGTGSLVCRSSSILSKGAPIPPQAVPLQHKKKVKHTRSTVSTTSPASDIEETLIFDQQCWSAVPFDEDNDATMSLELFLVTNHHVLQGSTAVRVYFRGECSGRFRIVELRTRSDSGEILYKSSRSEDHDSRDYAWVPDVAALRIRFTPPSQAGEFLLGFEPVTWSVLEVKYNPLSPDLAAGNDTFFEVTNGQTCKASGFPYLSDEEHTNWNYREPMSVEGHILARYGTLANPTPHTSAPTPFVQPSGEYEYRAPDVPAHHFRASMNLGGGNSGSLVVTIKGDAIVPVGVYSHFRCCNTILFHVIWPWTTVMRILIPDHLQTKEYLVGLSSEATNIRRSVITDF